MSQYCDRNIHDAISTGKIPENIWLCLVFSLGIFPVEVTSFMFLSQPWDTQEISYLLIIWGSDISSVFVLVALNMAVLLFTLTLTLLLMLIILILVFVLMTGLLTRLLKLVCFAFFQLTVSSSTRRKQLLSFLSSSLTHILSFPIIFLEVVFLFFCFSRSCLKLLLPMGKCWCRQSRLYFYIISPFILVMKQPLILKIIVGFKVLK